jgi:hypothetical protein
MLPSDYPCPSCKCQACYALHRKGLDWVMSIFGRRPARCLTCSRKFFARYKMSDNRQDTASATTPATAQKRDGLNRAA